MYMGYLVIVDTETTGVGNEDRVIQLATMVIDEGSLNVIKSSCDLCKTDVDIKEGASKIHGITNSDLADMQYLKQTDTYKLLEYYNTPENTFVMHNAFFDLYMLAKERFLIQAQLIDTITCARHIHKKLNSYKLQSLASMIEKKEIVQTHNALSDCEMCFSLLKNFMGKHSVETLVKLTQRPIIGFGKHKGTEFKILGKKNKDYVDWVLNNFDSLDAPSRLVLKASAYPENLDIDEQKALRYLRMDNLK